MPRVAPFDAHYQRYEARLEKHEAGYISELLAQQPFVPWEGRGVEIVVGSVSGKTTPLKCLGAVIEPTKGRMSLGGERALAVMRLLNQMTSQYQTAIIAVTHDEKIIPLSSASTTSAMDGLLRKKEKGGHLSYHEYHLRT